MPAPTVPPAHWRAQAAIREAEEKLKRAAQAVNELVNDTSELVADLETAERNLLGTKKEDELTEVQNMLAKLRQGVTKEKLDQHALNVQELSRSETVNDLQNRARVLFDSAMSQIMTKSTKGNYVNFENGGNAQELLNAPPMQKYRRIRQHFNNVKTSLVKSFAKLVNATDDEIAATRKKILDSRIVANENLSRHTAASSGRLDNALTNAGDEQRFLRKSNTFRFAHEELRTVRTPRDRHNRQEVAVRADIGVRAAEAHHMAMTTHLGEIVMYANLGSKRAIHYYGIVYGILSDVQTAENKLPDTNPRAVRALPANPSSGSSNKYEGLSAIFEHIESGLLEKLTHVLQQWASIRPELRGGAWPEPSVRNNLVELASKDDEGNSPKVDPITGEITMTTKRDRFHSVWRTGYDGPRVLQIVVPWVTIGGKFAVPVDEDCRTIRATPLASNGRPQWVLHKTFSEQVSTAADDIREDGFYSPQACQDMAEKGVSARMCYRFVAQTTKGDSLPPATPSRDPGPNDLKQDAAISHGIYIQISRRHHAEQMLPRLQESLKTFEDKIEKLKQLIQETSSETDGPLPCNLSEVLNPVVPSDRLHSIVDGNVMQTTRATIDDVTNARTLNQLLLARDDLTATIGRQRVAMGLQPLFVGDAEHAAFSTHPTGVAHVEVGERTDANWEYLDNNQWLQDENFAVAMEEKLKGWVRKYYGWQTDVLEMPRVMFFQLALPWMTKLKTEGLPFAKLGLKRESGGSSSSDAPSFEELTTWNAGDRVIFGRGPAEVRAPPLLGWPDV